MSNGNFYSPEAVRPMYDEIVPVYQAAFAEEPWFERSKCIDLQRRCVSGLSRVAVGSMCEMCGVCTTSPAYEPNEMINRFEELAASRQTVWYIEQSEVPRAETGITLAAIAWKSKPANIASEKYDDVPAMGEWMNRIMGEGEISWLDDIFANKALRITGNLQNFGDMCNGFMAQLDTETLAFRTISQQMLKKSAKVFDVQPIEVPDRRKFLVIRRSK